MCSSLISKKPESSYMMQETLTHLSKLVSFYPMSKEQNNVLEALKYCQKIFIQNNLHAEIHTHNHVHSLYASTNSTNKPRVLLHGHVDVVPAMANQRNIKTIKHKAYARGVYDDLFATAIYLSLTEDLKNELPGLDLGIMLTGDEELGGFSGTNYFVQKGYLPEICVMPDAGEGFGDLNVGCRGIYNFKVTVAGKSHHGSRPWDGDGAANKLVLLLNEIISLTKNTPEDRFTVSLTILEGGDSMNKAPSLSSAQIDIRYQTEKDLQNIKEKLAPLLKKYNGKISNLSAGPAFNLNLEEPLVKDFLNLYEEKAGKITLSKTTGSSDARFFAAKNIPVLMFRPEGGDLHGDNEWLNTEELQKTYNLIKEYLIKVAKI
jgi:succinyl-diaminopimelate desuccinylase